MSSFAELQSRLNEMLALNSPDGYLDHVVVELPSFSVGESLLSHYAERIPSLEHRYLNAMFMLDRIESCELVFVSCRAADAEVIRCTWGAASLPTLRTRRGWPVTRRRSGPSSADEA